MSNSNELTDRLLLIERELRIWRRIGGFATLVAVLTICVAAGTPDTPSTPSVIKAKEFQLIGNNGEVVVELKTLGNGTQLQMRDASGKSTVAIVANDSNAILDLANDNRINSAHIAAYAGGGSIGLSRKTGDGQASAQLHGGTDGAFLKLVPLKGDSIRVPHE